MSDLAFLGISVGLALLGVTTGAALCRFLSIGQRGAADLLLFQLTALMLFPPLLVNLADSRALWVLILSGLAGSPVWAFVSRRPLNRWALAAALMLVTGLAIETAMFISMRGDPRAFWQGVNGL